MPETSNDVEPVGAMSDAVPGRLTLTTSEIGLLWTVFDELDRTRDERVSPEELRVAVERWLGEDLSPAAAEGLLAEADANGDGHLSFSEFLMLVEHVRAGRAPHGGMERLVRAVVPQVVPSAKFWLYEDARPILDGPVDGPRGAAYRVHAAGGGGGGGGGSEASAGPAPVLVAEGLSATQATVRQLVAGGLAGAVAKTAVAPLERVKLLCQIAGMQAIMASKGAVADGSVPPHATAAAVGAGGSGGGAAGTLQTVAATGSARGTSAVGAARMHVPGVVETFQRVWRTDGVAGFWRGNLASVVRIIPNKAVLYTTHDQYKEWLSDRDGSLSPQRRLLAGALSGATCTLATYPLDLVRSRLASQEGRARQYDGIVDCLRKVTAKDGPRGLYQGMVPTLAGIIPYAAINFWLFENFKRTAQSTLGNVSVSTKLACGALSGMISQTVVFPVDTVRRRMQLQGAYTKRGERMYANSLQCFFTVLRQEGPAALFRGLPANLMRACPNMAIQLTTYEYLRDSFGVRITTG